jgi:glucosylceramidase
MVIGAFRNHSVASLWWNVALDPNGGPTNGGCRGCRGVVTVEPTTGKVTPNVEYWLLGHVGRYVPRGSSRLRSSPRTSTGIESVAFRTPSGGRVLLLLNDSEVKRTVTIRWSGRSAQLPLPAGAVATAWW